MAMLNNQRVIINHHHPFWSPIDPVQGDLVWERERRRVRDADSKRRSQARDSVWAVQIMLSFKGKITGTTWDHP